MNKKKETGFQYVSGEDKFHWDSDEFRKVKARASKLSVEELSELSNLVGIHFTGEEDGNLAPKEDYLGALDEADSKQKVYDYLEAKGQ